eukprot:scaffold45_cov368-Prasinococcus_capsulatus_cf.AAC.9
MMRARVIAQGIGRQTVVECLARLHLNLGVATGATIAVMSASVLLGYEKADFGSGTFPPKVQNGKSLKYIRGALFASRLS